MIPRTVHRQVQPSARRQRGAFGTVAETASGSLLMVLVGGGCVSGGPAVLADVTAPTASAGADTAAAARPPLVEVRLAPARATAPFRWDPELRGLVTEAVEMGLADLPGVVPVVGQAASPAVLFLEARPQRTVDASLRVVALAEKVDPVPVRLELELCAANTPCTTLSAEGTRTHPWDALGTLLDGAAAYLDVPTTGSMRAAWRAPASTDPYATLVAGRSAALLYGLLPWEAPAEGAPDPIARAVRIDPRNPLAQWTLARWDAGAAEGAGRAFPALQAAMLARPGSPVLAADLAVLFERTGRAEKALLAWDEVERASPADPRFQVGAARVLLATGRPDAARARLDLLPASAAWDPAVAALRVRIAEADPGTTPETLDTLFDAWQRVDPRAAEPVRRRIDLRVRQGRWDDALSLLPPLRARTPGTASDALRTSLLAARERWDDAAASAPEPTRRRLLARGAWSRDPAAAPELEGDDPVIQLARAESSLAQGERASALAVADAVLANHESRADAWVVRARALEGLGRGGLAAEAWSRAWERDPALPGGTVEQDRVASTFRLGATVPAESDVPTRSKAEPRGAGPRGPAY